jgi:hypothetical protein
MDRTALSRPGAFLAELRAVAVIVLASGAFHAAILVDLTSTYVPSK